MSQQPVREPSSATQHLASGEATQANVQSASAAQADAQLHGPIGPAMPESTSPALAADDTASEAGPQLPSSASNQHQSASGMLCALLTATSVHVPAALQLTSFRIWILGVSHPSATSTVDLPDVAPALLAESLADLPCALSHGKCRGPCEHASIQSALSCAA